MTTSLTIQDFSKIITKFDVEHGLITDPMTTEQRSVMQLALNRLPRYLSSEAKFPKDLVRMLACKLPTSVTSLFMLFHQSKALKGRSHLLTNDAVGLNMSSCVLLERLGINPTNAEGQLPHFKQLMAYVLTEHLKTLDISDQPHLLRQISLSTPDQAAVSEYALFGREKQNIRLFAAVWKTQSLVSTFLNSRLLKGLIGGSACYISYRLFSFAFTLMSSLNKNQYGMKNFDDNNIRENLLASLFSMLPTLWGLIYSSSNVIQHATQASQSIEKRTTASQIQYIDAQLPEAMQKWLQCATSPQLLPSK